MRLSVPLLQLPAELGDLVDLLGGLLSLYLLEEAPPLMLPPIKLGDLALLAGPLLSLVVLPISRLSLRSKLGDLVLILLEGGLRSL